MTMQIEMSGGTPFIVEELEHVIPVGNDRITRRRHDLFAHLLRYTLAGSIADRGAVAKREQRDRDRESKGPQDQPRENPQKAANTLLPPEEIAIDGMKISGRRRLRRWQDPCPQAL